MEKAKLQEVLQGLTIRQKIGQLVQLPGNAFGTESAVTGHTGDIGIHGEYNLYDTGSILNLVDPAATKELVERYAKNATHGIPLLVFADIIYGYRTVFPIPLAMACGWDYDAIKNMADITAKEAEAFGVHATFSPMVDIVRDPRWGRVMESPGEDALLASLYAKSVVEGFQGPDAENIRLGNIGACVKHFAAYGAPRAGLEYASVEMSEREFRQDYLPAYKAAVDARARLVMTAFNTLNGDPCTGNRWLNRDILRDELGFEGVLISDYTAVQELIAHGVAADNRGAAMLGMDAGVDIDMCSPVYANEIEGLVADGALDAALLDEAVLRILELKNALGLFEDPLRGLDPEAADSRVLLPASKKAALELAEKSCVLLKNKGLLPLQGKPKVAVVGPYAKSGDTLGMWALAGRPGETVTLYEGLAGILGEERVIAARGSRMVEDIASLGLLNDDDPYEDDSCDDEALLAEAVEAAKAAEVVVLAVGEHFRQTGEGGSRTRLTLPAPQLRLIEAVRAVGKPVAMVVYSGRPVLLEDVLDSCDALLYAWIPGTMGGAAVANLLCGKAQPSGRLTMTFPRSVGQIPIYHSVLPTGRPQKPEDPSYRFLSHYLDEKNTPLFPFGYGLTYSKVEYTGIALEGDTARVSVRNMGQNPVAEVVQLYLHDTVASISRPVKQLAAFRRVELSPGEEKTVEFAVTKDMLSFYNTRCEYVAEPGEFELMAGPNAESLPCRVVYTYEL